MVAEIQALKREIASINAVSRTNSNEEQLQMQHNPRKDISWQDGYRYRDNKNHMYNIADQISLEIIYNKIIIHNMIIITITTIIIRKMFRLRILYFRVISRVYKFNIIIYTHLLWYTSCTNRKKHVELNTQHVISFLRENWSLFTIM
jgi:hypothetical protein